MSVGSIRRKCLAAPAVLIAVLAMSAVAASSAWASGKPFVETKPATKITASEATLNGVVNPNGAETKYHFEYGTTTSYGSSTAEVGVGSGTTNVEALKKVASLSGLTKYDFRVVATNSNGTTDGSNEVFTTSGPEFKPVPTKKKFTLSGGTSEWRTVSGSYSITCTKTSATGEIDSAQAVGNVVVAYSGCKSSSKHKTGCPANSVGAKAGEIVTTPLDGELGTVATSEAASGVGLRFKQSPKGEGAWFTLQENECTYEAAFQGGLAAEVSVIGKKQTTNEFVFAYDGGQKIKEITLDSGVVEKPRFEAFTDTWTIEATDDLTFEEPVEIT